jgi:hypothetical protein
MSVTNPHDGRDISWREDEDRWTTERARYVEQTTPLDRTDAEIVAWAELGYSHAGISKAVELGPSTVKSHFDEIEAVVGPTALMTRKPDELALRSTVGLEGV